MDVPMHAGAVCIFSFPEKLAPKVLSSSADFEIKSWGDDGVAVRAVNDKASPATLALATATGLVKVNVTLRVVPRAEPALTLVRFKAVSADEAFDAQVKAEIARRIGPIQQRLEQQEKALDELIRRRTERLITEQIVRRFEVVKLRAHARNADHVILHVQRGNLVGESGFLVFEIENRSGAPYQLAAVRVIADGRDVAGDAQLAATAGARGPAPGLIGVVAPNTTVRGIVTIPAVKAVANRPLALELSMPNGRGLLRVDRGLVLR